MSLWVFFFFCSQTQRTERTSQKFLFIPKDLSLLSAIFFLPVIDILRRTVSLTLIYFTCAPPLFVYLNLCTPLRCPCIPALGLTFGGLFVLDLRRREAIASVLVLS